MNTNSFDDSDKNIKNLDKNVHKMFGKFPPSLNRN